MKVATWNINGVKARLETVKTWLEETRPDVVCLQEIKSQDDGVPREAFEGLGYNVATHGQKGFNGVALLSRLPLADITRGLSGNDGDEQARYIEATVTGDRLSVRIASLYLPNGNPIATDKFAYKLDWMRRFEDHARMLLATEMPIVLAGDYNVIPEPRDAKTPSAWLEDALYQPESRARLRRVIALGYADALRQCAPEDGIYTFWDYQAGAWPKNNGIRIDHMLLSAQAMDRVSAAGVDTHTRGWEKPSDHAPVWITLDA